MKKTNIYISVLACIMLLVIFLPSAYAEVPTNNKDDISTTVVCSFGSEDNDVSNIPTSDIKEVVLKDDADQQETEPQTFSADDANNEKTSELHPQNIENTATLDDGSATDMQNQSSDDAYTVTISHETYSYTMSGNTSANLDEVLSELGIEGNIVSAHTQNDDIVSASCDENGVWNITSNKPFDTDEQLEIVVEGHDNPIVLSLKDPTEYLVDLSKSNVSIIDNQGTAEQPQFTLTGIDRNGLDVNKIIDNGSTVRIVQTNSSTTPTSNVISVAFEKAKSFINLIFDKLNIKTDYGVTPVTVTGSGINNENAVTITTVGENKIVVGDNFTPDTIPADSRSNYGILVTDKAEEIETTIKSETGGSIAITTGDISDSSAFDPNFDTIPVFSHGPLVFENANATFASGNTHYNAYDKTYAIYSWHNITIKDSKIRAFSGDGAALGVIKAYDDGIYIIRSNVEAYAYATDDSGFGRHDSFRPNYKNMSINGYCLTTANTGDIIITDSNVFLKTGKARFNGLGVASSGNITIDNSNVDIIIGEVEYNTACGIAYYTNSDLSITNGSNVSIEVGKSGTGSDSPKGGWSIGIDGCKPAKIKDSNLNIKVDKSKQSYSSGIEHVTDLIFEGTTDSTIDTQSWAIYGYSSSNLPQFLSEYYYFDKDGTELTKEEVINLIENYELPFLAIKSTKVGPAPIPTPPAPVPMPPTVIVVPVEDGDTVLVEAEITNKKAVISDISVDTIKEVISKKDSTGAVSIDCSNTGFVVTQVEIKSSNIKTIAESDAKELKVSMNSGSIVLDKVALTRVADIPDVQTITLVVEEISNTVLNNQQKKAVESEISAKQNSKVIAVIDSYILANANKIKDLGSGKAVIEINSDNFSNANSEIVKTGNIIVYEISEDGTMKMIEFEIVDGIIVFDVNELSQYVILAM